MTQPTPIITPRSRALLPAAVLLTALVAFLAYRNVLEYGFTGTDTFTLIETSRISSAQDLVNIFTKPLMWPSDFLARGKFFRPFSSLSYSLDYAIWGMKPLGYHLTDLFLHLLVAGLVTLVMARLAGGDPICAAAAGVIFAVHPILVETVPSPAHRHDVLAAALMLLAILAFMRAAGEKQGGRGMKLLSLGCYILALGAKEIVVFFPALIAVHGLVHSRETGALARLRVALRAALPYFGVQALFLMWRTAVLGGLGGYQSGPVAGNWLENALSILLMYVRDLLYPQDIFSIVPVVPNGLFVVAVVGLLIACCLGLSLGGSCWGPRTTIFLAAWVLAPLPGFLFTSTFSHRSVYSCVIPVAGILGLTLVSGARSLIGNMSSAKIDTKRRDFDEAAPAIAPVLTGFLAALVLVGTLAWTSPLVRTYLEWSDSSTMTTMFFDRLTELVPKLEDNTTIDLYDLPAAIQRYRTIVPRARDVGYPIEYGVASWLRLTYPTRNVKIVVHSRFCPERLPSDLRLRLGTGEARRTAIVVSFVGTGGRSVAGGW